MTAMMCALAPSMHCLAPLSSTLSELEPARGKLMITPPFSTEISWISWERGGEVSEFQYPQEKEKKEPKKKKKETKRVHFAEFQYVGSSSSSSTGGEPHYSIPDDTTI